jgi:uncharacterized membrane protein
MATRRRLWLLLPRQVRALPADLVAVIAVVGLTVLAVFVPVLNDSPVRVVIGLAFTLFVPGYAFIAALFPEAGRSPVADEPPAEAGDEAQPTESDVPADPGEGPITDRGIDGIERVALSFGLSIAIVPLIGLALNFTPFGIRLVPIVVSISAFTLVATAVAAIRRWELPEAERFSAPYREWLAAGRAELFHPESTLDAALNVALAVAVLLAVSSVVYAVAVPPQGERFTEFYILGEDADGELVADNYPEELVAGEPASLYVGVGNNEHETVRYTIVVQLQAVEGEGNDSQVTNRAELDRWSTTVAHNETSIEERSFTLDNDTAAEFNGTDRRLSFLLYDETPPGTPTRENAYRDVHLWVNVSTAP